MGCWLSPTRNVTSQYSGIMARKERSLAKLLLFSNRNDCLSPPGAAESVTVSPSHGGLDTVESNMQ